MTFYTTEFTLYIDNFDKYSTISLVTKTKNKKYKKCSALIAEKGGNFKWEKLNLKETNHT